MKFTTSTCFLELISTNIREHFLLFNCFTVLSIKNILDENFNKSYIPLQKFNFYRFWYDLDILIYTKIYVMHSYLLFQLWSLGKCVQCQPKFFIQSIALARQCATTYKTFICNQLIRADTYVTSTLRGEGVGDKGKTEMLSVIEGWGVSGCSGRPIFNFFIKENWIFTVARHHAD